MALKILGGSLKGLLIPSPKTDVVRPTSVLLRRRVFDSFQDLSGYRFFDLCAGSGTIGIEALSRGALQVVFVEKNRTLVTHLRELSKKINREGQIRIYPEEVTSWILKRFKKEYEQFTQEEKEMTILFLDPPYEETKIYEQILKTLEGDWFKGLFWVESDTLKGVPPTYFSALDSQKIKEFYQGDSYLFIFSFN